MVSIRVCGILQLYDGFTGKPLTHGVQIITPNKTKIIQKSEGYYIILGESVGGAVVVQSPIFETEQLYDINAMHVCTVYLTPNQKYHYPEQTVFVSGMTQPKQIVYGCPQHCHMWLQQQAEQGSDTLSIHMEQHCQIQGRFLCLSVADSQQYEIVHVIDGALCKLSTPLKTRYPKIKTCVYPLFLGRADETGMYTLALPHTDFVILDAQCTIIQKI